MIRANYSWNPMPFPCIEIKKKETKTKVVIKGTCSQLFFFQKIYADQGLIRVAAGF